MARGIPYSTERRKPRVQTINDEPSVTVQSDRHNADIREIMARYDARSFDERMRDVELAFHDVTTFDDFTDLMRQSRRAQEAFMELPAQLREVFDNDASVWLDAAHDPDKLESLRPKLAKLGLVEAVPFNPPQPEPLAASGEDG